MCGIIGSFNNTIDKKALSCIVHRGPDAQQTYQYKNLTLGHVRLSIVDLSDAGSQPMHSENERFTLIFNGEIYNHQELRSELSFKNFKGHSDTETILYYLQEFGIEGVKKFNGIFALALLDKELNKLYLVRDPFGVKPLYFYEKEGKVISFASEIKPLFALGTVKEFNHDYLSTYLKLRYVPAPNTLFKNIFKVDTASILEIDITSQKITQRRFFDNIPKPIKKINKEEALEQYDFLLKKAINRQLMGDVPVSMLLSGGVDSALLAKLITDVSNTNLKTYTGGYRIADDNINELEDAEESAQILGLENEKVIIEESSFIEIFPQLTKNIEEPLGSTSIFPIHFLTQKIHQDGFKVTLTGQGVDEPWGGYLRYNPQKTIESLSGLPVPFLSTLKHKIKKDGLRRAVNAVEQDQRAARFNESYSLFDEAMLKRLLREKPPERGFKNRTIEIIQYKLKFYQLEDRNAVEAMMILDARMNLSDDLLLYTDKVSMQHSIETRVPFLDLELMHFAESLPSSLKVGLFKNKWLHKKLAEKHLPKKIIYRKKRGFYAPTKSWFEGQIGHDLEEQMLSDVGLFSQLFNKEEIKKYFDLHRHKKVNYEKQLYLLSSFYFWTKEFF
ncbi:asparagine synthase (glutamine-hydrolyzing) [Mesonia ostreae]|uniref:asparagine synthase (glutamine-hydrolyzing) n=1 Tax=Mesonia ostreae TaxID=861110 RepID=A0ABU2KIZ8_9FLAO|nr:asparagine synthase (glutamine-hydrolyzing) [Mesonia ostreae]MDT0294654.1 asparagine synthase (glutamine-hydrolyzing) [Mesonia ostreae]